MSIDSYRAARPGHPDDEATRRALEAAAARALSHWPSLDVEALSRALAALEQPVTELSTETSFEVALCLAIAEGDTSAIARLEAEYLRPTRAALHAMKLGAAQVEEVLQETRRKLLVGDPPKIVAYAGRGSLRGLLKVTATRTALSMLRKSGRESPGDEAVLDAEGPLDPELTYLKVRYRAHFREAFAEAIDGLSPRERNLLRLHFLQRVTLERLATMYGVHRATIVRHLARVRDSIRAATKARLRERLDADPAEVEAVLELIASHYDASVERLLRTMER